MTLKMISTSGGRIVSPFILIQETEKFFIYKLREEHSIQIY